MNENRRISAPDQEGWSGSSDGGSPGNVHSLNPFSVVVLGNFRRFYFPTLLIYSSELQFFPFLRGFFSALFRAFFVEKIFWICYNNSTL